MENQLNVLCQNIEVQNKTELLVINVHHHQVLK
jgi:hypothetical protein